MDSFLFDYIGWLLSLLHIGAVVSYANWKKWGSISLGRDGTFRVPGGALVSSIPITEILVVWAMSSIAPNQSVNLILLLASHMLRVRIILIFAFGVPAFIQRMRGRLVEICMDDRLSEQSGKMSGNIISLHNDCGAYSTLTLAGLMPLLPFAAIALVLHLPLPIWVLYLSTFPYYFLFTKHWHVLPSVLPSTWQVLSEGLPLLLNALYFWSKPLMLGVQTHDSDHSWREAWGVIFALVAISVLPSGPMPTGNMLTGTILWLGTTVFFAVIAIYLLFKEDVDDRLFR